MTERESSVVVEILCGPLDGYRCSAQGQRVSVGASVEDDVTVADDRALADARLRLEVLADGEVRVTAAQPFRVDGREFRDEATAKSGSVVRAGATEFRIVEAHAGRGAGRGDGTTPVTCPKCGTVNDPQSPWCGNCGHDL